MGSSLPVKVMNALIVISLLVALGAVGSVLSTVALTAPTISVGSVSQETGGSVTQIQVPVTLTNKGLLSLSDITVRLDVTDSSNEQLLSGLAGPVTIAPGANSSVTAIAFLDTNSLPTAVLQRFATTSQNLTVHAVASASLPPFVKVAGNVSSQLSWGAPVSGLTIGTPSFSSFNSTAVVAAVPVSFRNLNSYVTIMGAGTIEVLNSSGDVVGGGTVQVDVPPGTGFSQDVSVALSVTPSQAASLILDDQTLNYSAVLSFESSGQNLFNTTEPISYEWEAPLSLLSFGIPSAQPYNSTCSSFSVPFTFTDESAFVRLSGTVTGTVGDPSGTVGSISPLAVSAAPGEQFSGDLTGYVKTSSLSAQTLTLSLAIETQQGTVTEEAIVNA